jgi:hypothetical protein
MKRCNKTLMTPLEKGLAVSARKEGLTLEAISKALRRDPRSIQRLLRQRNIPSKTNRWG